MKALVESGRLPKFLNLIVQRLAEAEPEYAEVAALAEKLTKVVD